MFRKIELQGGTKLNSVDNSCWLAVVHLLHVDQRNPCRSQPCTNGGSCSYEACVMTCQCPDDFTGELCEGT